MTELDFDELDKAVNNLMSDVDTSKRTPGLDDPEDKVVTLEMSDNPTPTPELVSGVDSTERLAVDAAPVVIAAPVAPLAVKRRGQFMDMIHPSSDMKSASPGPVNRRGVTLQPSSRTVVPEPSAPVSAPEPASVAMPSLGIEMESTGTGVPPAAEQLQPVATPSEQPLKNEWPDPIDMMQSETPPAGDVSTVNDAEHEELVSTPEPQFDGTPPYSEPVSESSAQGDEVHLGTELAQPDSLSSPFLTDAKVEKRPLGMPMTDESQPESSESSEQTPDAENDIPRDDNSAVLLPDELKSDVMSLESSNTSTATQPEPVIEAAPEAAPLAVAETGAGSIQQQYTEQPSTGDQTNTPIFDTSTHEQPLESPKKKSPLKWILLIIVLLIIGAAAGAAYFYYTTQ